MRSLFLDASILLLLSPFSAMGFGVKPYPSMISTSAMTPSLPASSPSALHLMDVPFWNAAQSLWIATIDGDIDKIPENEFATVFAGGIMVMVGGLLSAIIVGAILEKGNLYADLAAESYLKSADDAEFWKNLSEEEKKKAELVLSKIKEAKEGGVTDPEELKETTLGAIEYETQPVVATSDIAASSEPQKEKEVAKASSDIFSDYGD
mmetsp:Transcript_136/g.268  ORF Transcript_136/g.268 Transcript_136/m.268 type:complete len:207 (+) Transcript_136:142-762(+)